MIGPLPYIGGKRRLAPLIVTLLPQHVTYVEPFAGGAQVFFHKPRSPVEVLNDLDGELVNFLRVVQQHSPELIRWLRHMVPSRTLHGLLSRQNPDDLTDIQRAARVLFLQKNSFGGRVVRRSFTTAVTKPSNYKAWRIPELLSAAATRLEHAQLENTTYQRVLTRFDRPTTLFFLDPPYVSRALYRFNLKAADYEALAAQLNQLRGKFLLTINDHQVSRRAFGRFHMGRVTISYTASRLVPRVTELLFANFPLPRSLVAERIQIPDSTDPG